MTRDSGDERDRSVARAAHRVFDGISRRRRKEIKFWTKAKYSLKTVLGEVFRAGMQVHHQSFRSFVVQLLAFMRTELGAFL